MRTQRHASPPPGNAVAHFHRGGAVVAQRLGQAAEVVGVDAPRLRGRGVARVAALLGRSPVRSRDAALELYERVLLHVVLEQNVGHAAQRYAVTLLLEQQRLLGTLARRDVHEQAADLHGPVGGLHLATRVHDPHQLAVLLAHAVLRLVRRPLREAAAHVRERLVKVGRVHDAGGRAPAHGHEFLGGVAQHARQALVHVHQPVGLGVLAHLQAAGDVRRYEVDGLGFLAHQLLQVLVALPAGLEGEELLVLHGLVGVRHVDVPDPQLAALVHQLVAAALALLQHQARVRARAHPVAPHDRAGALPHVHQAEVLVRHLAWRRERGALQQVRHDSLGIGGELDLAGADPGEAVGEAADHALHVLAGVEQPHRLGNVCDRLVEKRVHAHPPSLPSFTVRRRAPLALHRRLRTPLAIARHWQYGLSTRR